MILLAALVVRRNAAVVLGSAAVVGVGGAALLAASGLGAEPFGLGWERLMPLAGVLGTAAAYALLRPLLSREDETRFSLPARHSRSSPNR